MVTAARPTDHPLIEELLAEPHHFSFFQAVNLLERANPDSMPVGGDGPAAREIIRFRPEVNLGFPPSSISTAELVESTDTWGAEESRYRLTACIFGLYGAQSPLPNHYAEDILQEQEQDTTVRDFLDIFHHRIYSLFYRVWQKYRYPVQFRLGVEDDFTRRFLALVGLGSPEVQQAAGLEPRRLLRYAGLLVQHPRSSSALGSLVADWFGGVGTEVVECTGRWVNIRPDDRNRLGQQGCRLGEDMVVGERVYDRSGQYRLILGPVDLPAYRRFLPDGEDHDLLNKLTRFFVTDNLDAELEVRLLGSEVPPLQLVSDEPPRLGWTSWLSSGPSPEVRTLFQLVHA